MLCAWKQRIWFLGPKRIGPNLLMTSNVDSPSLFDPSTTNIVLLDKKRGIHRPAATLAPTVALSAKQNDIQSEIASEENDDDAQSKNAVAVEVGFRQWRSTS